MPNWKKLIVSGSDAALNSLTVTTSVTATSFTGSFSGSFTAPGSTTQVLYNSGGVVSAASGLVYSGSNVGIGTTSPDGKLHIFSGTAGTVTPNAAADDFVIENSGHTGMSILSPDASSSIIRFGSPSDQDGAEITWNYDASMMTIATSKAGAAMNIRTGNEGDAVRITSGGNTLIGTTTDAGYKFDVNGTGRFVNGVNMATTSGNVGIGTSSPGVRLDVVGANSAEGQLYVGNTDVSYTAGINFTTSGTNRGFVGWRHTYSTAPFNLTGIHLFNTDNSNIVFGTNNLVRAVIDTNGNVGIGTTSPGQSLEVYGGNGILINTTGNSNLRVKSGAASLGRLIFADQVGDAGYIDYDHNIDAWYFRNAGDTKVTILTSGNVGIGTTSPTAALNVSGTNKNIQLGATATVTTSNDVRHIFAGAGAFIGQDAAGEANIGNNIYYNTGFKRRVLDFSSNIRFNSGITYFQSAASGAADSAITWADNMTILQNGNVGIGTTTPSSKLSINGGLHVGGDSDAGDNNLLVDGTMGVTGIGTFSTDVTIAGTLTVQTIVAQTITSSISFITGSTKFGSLLSNTHQFTGSVSMTGSLAFNDTLTTYTTLASSAAGSNTLFTQATGSYTSAFFKYTATSASNARSGEVVAIWNGAATEYADYSTVDIGTTNNVTASVSLAAANVLFSMQTNSASWKIKSIATYM